MKILITGGRVIDPAHKIDGRRDILVENTRISRVGKDIKAKTDKVIDASGKIVIPGLVDMHVHLREPGREDKETVESGTKAALKGGITSVLAMPNTNPAIDSAENLGLLKKIIKNTAQANVFIAGAITKGRLGKELSDIAGLKKLGMIAITDDGSSVDNQELLKEALEISKQQGILVISHCEDKLLSASGVVNLGVISTRLGLRGISRESEYKRVERDIKLAGQTGARLHIAHVSLAESVDLVARAKKKGLKVTCETAPHYFSLSEEAVLEYDTNMKMNPPLRTKKDVRSVREGLKNGTIDIIASDHAPHTEYEKEIEFDRAEFGVTGLETELAASVTELINPGILTWKELVEKLSLNPSALLNIDRGTLGPGKEADITVVSAEKEWIVQKEDLVSKSKNSPFLGRKFLGAVEYTIRSGKIVYQPAV
ncbi:MAG: dihydroorotase [Candidatus Omnitrophica bacterium]|nr:dihydroorotase [Candidatus Omnitrophota bacterium]